MSPPNPLVQSHFASEDRFLAQIRNQIESVCSHPDAVSFRFEAGELVLSGVALNHEADLIERSLEQVKEIQWVRNRICRISPCLPLDTNQWHPRSHAGPAGLRSMRPAMRWTLGILGFSLLAYGGRRRDLAGILLAGIGIGALTRALTNLDTASLFEFILHPQLTLSRQMEIHAPVESVFQFWSHFENYSKFMSYVKEVRLNERHGFTWTLRGPAGTEIHWDSEIRELIPCQKLVWESHPRALISNRGEIEFRSIHKGRSTRLDIQLTYAPPAGALGWETIRILGFDPRQKMDSDLRIMKALIEGSVTSAAG